MGAITKKFEIRYIGTADMINEEKLQRALEYYIPSLYTQILDIKEITDEEKTQNKGN